KLLNFSNLTRTFQFGAEVSLNIDGLLLTPQVQAGGKTVNLSVGEYSISIDGKKTATNPNPPGYVKITKLSDLAALKGLFSKIVVVRNGSLDDFSSMTPGDLVTLLIQMGNSIQSIAPKLNVPQGIPLVQDALSGIADFAKTVTDFARQLYNAP